ncbi:Ankyrin repeat, PH and SEC7 domain containing protein secG [Colletotrichum fructicola]|nr:Ankyrin repeat, PH and SEC7 domain containing protein secG [Colletotrichum fructicola]KAF4932296.1 Ankyrin repeat, PH and SEC7 domain containing protein secG [Colletotrichum fructicola]
MADPLSISASIAGLVTLADTVFLRLTKYIKSVQSADKEIKDLCKEVNLLGGAVNMLARLARGHELEDEPFNRDFRMYHIEACALILNDISQKTKKYDGNSKSKLLKLKWPYESSITKGLLADLSRHKDNINLALTANSMDALLRCLAKEEDRAKATATIRADVKKTREIFVRIQEDKKRTEVLRFFLHYNPQPNYEMSVKLRHPRTGMWLDRLPAFQTWLSSGASRIWLSGIPGAGKTVLADFIIGQALARSSDTVASGFFFCDYKNEKTQTPANVLGALAHQLARQNEQAYVILEEYHKELNPKNGLPRSLDSDDLVRVIVTMAQKFKKVYLVVDGLDECQDSTEDVVRALCVISESSEAISMALLSRNEDNIRDHLQDPNRCFENIQIAAHTEDITEYVTSEIQQRIDNKKLYLQDLSLKGEIVDSLVDGAKGMFRWVACQLDHLGYCMSDEQCREALRSLPPDLPETYLRILRRVPRAHQMHVQLILNCIAFAKPRLTIAQLREMLSVPSKGSLLKSSGLIHGDAITRYCSSLVRRANDRDHLEFAHFSVQEYLLSNDLMLSEFEMFSISKRRFNRLLALRSLEYVQLDNFDHSPTSTPEEVSYMEKRDFQYPFYEYAARNWLCYAREEWDDPKLLAAAARLFDLRKSSMFTSWAVTLVLYLRRHCMKDQMAIIAEIIDKRFTPIHLAATMALPEVVSILLRHGTRFQIERHIGSPFNYAVDCLYGAARHLSGYIRELRHISFMPPYIGNKASDYHFTLPTIKVLFEYYDSVPKGLMGLGLRTWMLTDDFSVLELLVVHDAALLESDLEDFSFHARELVRVGTSSWDAQRMRSLCGFCETLSAVIENSALHFELCRQAWELALQLAENTEHLQNIRIDPRISEDEKSLDSLALSACLNLHIDNLSWVVNDKRLSPSSIQSNNGNGLLHNLVLAQRSKKDMHLVVRALDVLLKAGCSLSTKNDDGHTPLSLALDRGDTPLVKTLLARVEIEQGAWQSKVPILLSVAQLGSEEVLDKLLDLGFEVLTTAYETNTPLHLDASNTEGLSMLLSHLRENENEYCQRVSTARPTVIERAVNQKVEGSTPLHQAIKRNNQAAVRLLIDNGADIEATDSLNRTPLLLATEHAANIDALSIVRMLIQAGSNIACRDDEGAGPLSRACASLNLDLILYLIELDVDINTVDQTGLNALHFLLLEPDGVDRNSLLPSMFLRLTQMLIDPYQPEKFSWSALQLSMQRRSMTTFLLNGEFHTWKFAPMPWSTTPRCRAFPEVACLTSGFRLYRRKMSFERFRELLNTEFADAWSPLCRAAAIGNTEVMKNLLSMGSVIDYEGCPEGSALMIASRAGLLDSVIFLTRHGASISFQGRKQYWSAVDASARSMRILRWLLVDRFTDQFKLKNAPKQSDISTEKFKKWSGITKAEMVIVGPWERRASESSPNYWSRLEQMRQDFHGKVVPLRQGAKTRRQSKLVPAEPVRIAAGGYNSTDENR